MDKQLIEQLRAQANEIASAGHTGWGNTMRDAADKLERIDAERGKSPDSQDLIRTAPARIWLQVSEDADHYDKPFPLNTEDVSWCESSVLDCEVEYIRADISTAIPEGMALVPIEPTDVMVKSINDVMWPGASEKAYRAMISAAQGERK